MDDNKSRMKEMPTSFTLKQALEFEWWFALLGSMTQSKTLTAMVILGCSLLGGFGFYLFNLANT
ncbi:hypothetical protein FGD67_00735 [Colwellia sp. M166]|uniref:hypothetical protein n=1 Tax=Colwellia sp. M166 TaxID=2583805 RepID=UPI00211E089B|nr:hypothetical protein [Colwellia sp. M166]UUO21885.1 hypothetical protein FGD67_00735 [Colwellia sp. M166]|tara:strand:- start:65 stop:256 length:192 start_codon:yes stop_codon:yes gene_type:complete